jgi:integrase/recombinase XerD
VVEKIMPMEPGKQYPLCLAGARACPPEDCGGDWGYVELLEILNDPRHERHAEMTEWLGRPFDPEAFDLNHTDQAVRKAPSRVEFR